MADHGQLATDARRTGTDRRMHRLTTTAEGWTCTCGSGWILPADSDVPAVVAHAAHVAIRDGLDALDVFKDGQ